MGPMLGLKAILLGSIPLIWFDQISLQRSLIFIFNWDWVWDMLLMTLVFYGFSCKFISLLIPIYVSMAGYPFNCNFVVRKVSYQGPYFEKEPVGGKIQAL